MRRSFELIVPPTRARVLSLVWADAFRGCIRDGKIVALPESYELKRFGKGPKYCDGNFDIKNAAELETVDGRNLIRFSPGTLTLIAGANSVARKRFDRLKVEYAWATLDDPKQRQAMIDFMRKP